MLRSRSRKTMIQMIQSKSCAGDARSCSMLIDLREAKDKKYRGIMID
jgi:hypothetical protein